jgi:hypothetical protein
VIHWRHFPVLVVAVVLLNTAFQMTSWASEPAGWHIGLEVTACACAGSVVAVPSDWLQPGLCCWAPVFMQTMLPPLIQESVCAEPGQVINLLFVLAYTAEMFAKMAQERTLKCAHVALVFCKRTIYTRSQA